MHTEAQLKKKGKKENHRKIKLVQQTGEKKRWNGNPRQSLYL